MKISPISNNFNKKATKPSFGTVYLNDSFGLNEELRQKLKTRIEKLEKQYPDTDCYLESERESNALFNAVFIVTEKGPNGPLKKVLQPHEQQKGVFAWVFDRMFGPPEMESGLDPNLFAVRGAINGDYTDRFLNAAYDNKGELVAERVYRIVDEYYKRYANLRTIAAGIAASHPDIAKPKLIEMSKELEQTDYRNKPLEKAYNIQDFER